jgi:hypothetical protein
VAAIWENPDTPGMATIPPALTGRDDPQPAAWLVFGEDVEDVADAGGALGCVVGGEDDGAAFTDGVKWRAGTQPPRSRVPPSRHVRLWQPHQGQPRSLLASSSSVSW